MLAKNSATSSEPSEFSVHAHLSTMLFYLQSELSSEQQNWLLEAIADVTQGGEDSEEVSTLVSRYTSAVKRNIKDKKTEFELPLYDDDGFTNGLAVAISHWSMIDVARVTLVAVALTGTCVDSFELLEKIYDFSDHSEQKSLVQGLYWLSDDNKLLTFAERVQRTNMVDEFCALAQFNPLPAKRYSDQAFNQLVLKSLFLKLNIERIFGFQQRCNAELTKMSENYLHELHLADRDIPASLWLALNSRDSSTETLHVWVAALESKVDEQRYYAIKSLRSEQLRDEFTDSLLIDKIDERMQVEQHPAIFALVQEMHAANL